MSDLPAARKNLHRLRVERVIGFRLNFDFIAHLHQMNPAGSIVPVTGNLEHKVTPNGLRLEWIDQREAVARQSSLCCSEKGEGRKWCRLVKMIMGEVA